LPCVANCHDRAFDLDRAFGHADLPQRLDKTLEMVPVAARNGAGIIEQEKLAA